MGLKMEKIFKVVSEKAGLDARMRLASKTGITKQVAAKNPDNEEQVKILKDVASELLGEDISKYL